MLRDGVAAEGLIEPLPGVVDVDVGGKDPTVVDGGLRVVSESGDKAGASVVGIVPSSSKVE